MDRKGTTVPPSPLEVMIESMNADKTSGMTCQLKRRLPDGSLVDTDAKALNSLSTKSRLAYAAQNLKQMKPEDRTAWALEMKDFANALYAEQLIQEAMEKYVEALAASNFGTIVPKRVPPREGTPADDRDVDDSVDLDMKNVAQANDSNVDILIIPVLCNLAACCIQLKQFSKALKFADAALELRPRCGKALMRRGMVLVHLGENVSAISALKKSLDIVEGSSKVETKTMTTEALRFQSCMPVSETDRLRIPLLLERAERAQAIYEKAKLNKIKQMKKIFSSETSKDKTEANDEAVAQSIVNSESSSSTGTRLDSIIYAILVLCVALYAFYLY